VQASLTEVKIYQNSESVCMEIHDNGQGFEVGSEAFFSRQSKRPGLLGMRERVEMVGGSFSVQSPPEKEATVILRIPGTKTLTKNPQSV